MRSEECCMSCGKPRWSHYSLSECARFAGLNPTPSDADFMLEEDPQRVGDILYSLTLAPPDNHPLVRSGRLRHDLERYGRQRGARRAAGRRREIGEMRAWEARRALVDAVIRP